MRALASKLWQSHRDETIVRKCEQYAQYTLPGMFVDPLQSTQKVQHDFQSVGGLLTNNLASKLVGALFPAGVPFFKNVPSDELAAAAKRQGVDMQVVSAQLAQLDREAAERLFLNAATAKLTRAIKLLIITGNVLMYREGTTAKFTVWSLRSFVVQRVANGDWRTIILKQRFQIDELPENLRNDYLAKNQQAMERMDTNVELFTVIEKAPGMLNPRVVVWNEIDGKRCGPESSYPEHLSPWVLATWNLSDGEHYGRGLVEDFTGDFAKLSLVSEQLGLYELEALTLLNLVDEAAGGVVDEYQDSDTGDYVRGKTGAITSYERGDYNKIAAIRSSLAEVIQRLSAAFMYVGNTRDAERVTAEEIRATAREAENTLGGVYSLLAEQLQVPLAYLTMLEVRGDLLEGLVSKMYKPSIITGIPALSRAIAVQNLLAATQEAAAIIPPLVQLDDRIDPKKAMNLIYNSRSVDTSLLFKDPEVLAAEAEAKKQAADMAEQASSASLVSQGATVQDSLQQLG